MAAIAVVAVTACGGSGGGGTSHGAGNGLPPSSGPGDVESFFPNSQGDSWNYFATATNPPAGDPSIFMDAVSVVGTKMVAGVAASVFVDSNPSGSATPLEGYYFKNAGGLAFLGTNDATDKITPALIPYVVALFPVTPGIVAEYAKTGLDFGSDLDGDGINETVNVSVTNRVVDFEALTIGIGSFARTVKTTEEQSGSVVLSRTLTSIPFTATSTRWLAPGIGVVKTDDVTTVQSTTSGESMEARGYTVNGVAHGLGLPYSVATNLAPGDSNLYSPGPPALATDGSHFLAVTGSPGGLTVKLLDATGGALNGQSLPGASGPLAAFDGTNYWVVYRGGSLSALARRVSAAGDWVDLTDLTLVAPGASTITSTGFAFGGSAGLLAYSRFEAGQHLLYGVIVHANGTASAPFPIAIDNSTHLNPAVAFDGTNFFVVWMQLATTGATDGDLYGVRVSTAGSVVDPAPIAISTAPNGQSSPSVAFDGSNYMAVWLDMRNQTAPTGVPYPDVYAARVSTGGQLIDGPPAAGGFPVASGGTLERYSPQVAFLGTEFLVAWACLGYANTGSPGIQAARVSSGATLPSGANTTITVSGPPSASTASQLAFPTLAAGPQQGAIIWLDNSEMAGSQKQLVGASMSPF